MGASPPGPPFAHPRWLRVRRRIGPHLWRGCQSGLLAPSFGFVGGHPPRPPRHGAFRPLGPRLPALGGLGFAGVSGPPRGGVANVGYSPPLSVLWGDTPKPPAMGASPPGPPFAHPRWLRVRRRIGSHSWRGDKSRLFAPNFGFWGHIPQTPCQGALPPWTPFAHPRELRACQRFGPHSWRGC